MVTTPFPNAEVVMIAYLRTLSLPANTMVVRSLPTDYDGSQIVVRVNRIGGAAHWPDKDSPVYELRCWGPDIDTASTLLDVVRTGLSWMELANADFTAVGAVFSNPAERLGPQWFDEEAYMSAGSYMFELNLDIRRLS